MDRPPIQPLAERLTQREMEVLALIADGLSNREIAQQLFLSLNTVKWYNKELFAKLGARNRTEAVKLAREHSLLRAPGDERRAEKPPSRGNLPAQLTSYVGRERELDTLQALLAKHRLVVLTGPGGTGKTRLALELAERMSDAYHHGAWLVELAMLTSADLVADAIGRVLRVKASSDTPPIDAVKNSLRRKRLLLLLDNFEHLLEAGSLVSELLSSAPGVTVLATSRERLHLYGEVEYPVPPLSLSDPGKSQPIEEVLASEAVALFIQRARAAYPQLAIDDTNVAAAARICRRLDGLPLAIELAATQVKMYPPAALAQRLEDSLGTLAEGPRDRPARQRTLRATLKWSVNLLEEDEKRLFWQLSVFRGGSVLDGIQRVCGPGLRGDLFGLLSALVDHSLVFVREGPEGEPRFAMLGTIAEFAQEELLTTGEADEIRERHAAYFAELAEEFSQGIQSPRHMYWNARMQAEQGNLNAALAWSLSGTESPLGLRMVAALTDYWYHHGTAEDTRWGQLALERLGSAPAPLRAAVISSVGTLYHNLGDMTRVASLHRQAVDLYRQIGDERNAAWSTLFLSIACSKDPDQIQNCQAMAKQSLAILRRLGDKAGMARALSALGELYRMSGEYESAKSCYTESLALAQDTGERMRQAVQYGNLGAIAYHLGQHLLAIEQIQLGVTILQEMDFAALPVELYLLAGPVAALGHSSEAATLLGAADAQVESSGLHLQPPDQQDMLAIRDAVRRLLDEEGYQTAWDAGYVMDTQEAIAFALGLCAR